MSFFSKKNFPDGIFSLNPLGKLIIKGLDNIGNTCDSDETFINNQIRNNLGEITVHNAYTKAKTFRLQHVKQATFQKGDLLTGDKSLCTASCQSSQNLNYYYCQWTPGVNDTIKTLKVSP